MFLTQITGDAVLGALGSEVNQTRCLQSVEKLETVLLRETNTCSNAF